MSTLVAAELCRTAEVQFGQKTFTAELRRWKPEGSYELYLSNAHGGEAWGVSYSR